MCINNVMYVQIVGCVCVLPLQQPHLFYLPLEVPGAGHEGTYVYDTTLYAGSKFEIRMHIVQCVDNG